MPTSNRSLSLSRYVRARRAERMSIMPLGVLGLVIALVGLAWWSWLAGALVFIGAITGDYLQWRSRPQR